MTVIFFLFLGLHTDLHAQVVSGNTIEADTKMPLTFVNVGILNGTIGTVSDEEGRFSLDLSGVNSTDTLRFSAIGYETKDVIVREVQGQVGLNISMTKTSYVLQEVRVVPKDYKVKKVGNHMTSEAMSAGFKDNLLGYEVGTRMKIKNRPAILENVTIHFARCEYDSIFYRLNIYEMDGKLPGKNVLTEPIYLSYSKAEALAGLEIDMTPYSIWVEDDFLVSLELVKDHGPGGLFFCCGFFASKALYRETSQAKWQKIPMGVGISIGALIRQEI